MNKKEREKFILANDKDVLNFLKAFRIILIITFILITAILINALFVKGSSDIVYTFNSDTLYSNSVNEPDYSFNIRNQTTITDDYYGNYSFENENGLKGTEIGFVDVINLNPTNTLISVIESFNGHDEILNVSDQNFTGYVDFHKNLENTFNNLTIEYWFAISNITTTGGFVVRFYETSTIIIDCVVDNDDLLTYNPTGTSLKSNFLVVDQWYHLKFVLDDNANTFDFYLNGILEKNDLAYKNPSTIGINKIQMGSGTDDLIDVYFDAIGIDKGNHYEATYSFENDIIGNVPNDWTVNNPFIAQIDNNIYDHNNVLNLTGNGANGYIENSFNSLTGTITLEFWVLRTTINGQMIMRFIGSGYQDLYFNNGGSCTYYARNGSFPTFFTMVANSWYHFKWQIYIDGVYDVLNIWVNGIKYVNNEQAYIDSTQFTLLRIFRGNSDGNLILDGMGYSWDNDYTISDNIIPYWYNTNENMIPITETDTTTQEVDKWEFSMFGINTMNAIGSSNANNWTETGSTSLINIGNDYSQSNDRYYSVDIDSMTSAGLFKEFVYSSIHIINFSMRLNITQLCGSPESYVSLSLQDQLPISDIIAQIYIVNESSLIKLKWRNARISGFETLRTDLTPNAIYSFDVYIDMSAEFCILDYYKNDVFIQKYYLKTNMDDLTTLNDVIFNVAGGSSGYHTKIHLDSFGLYLEGASLSTDFGYCTYDILPNWNIGTYPNIKLKAGGNTSFLEVASTYTLGQASYIDIYDDWDYLDNSEYTYYYSTLTTTTNDPIIVQTIKGNVNLLNFLEVDNTYLENGLVKHYIQFSFLNVDTRKSCFYVENNKLYYNIITNDLNLEYIKAIFDIPNFNSVNYSCLVGGYKSIGALFSEIRINFIGDTFNFYSLKTWYTSQPILLSQDKTIETIEILISDNDNDVNVQMNGYVNSITFKYNPNQNLNITTSSLIAIIIPLAIISAPTVAVWGSTKKKFGSFLLIPMIMGMSIVCYSMTLIPVWLLFVMLVCCGFLYFSKWENYLLVFTTLFTMISGFGIYANLFPVWIFYISFLSMTLVGVFAYKQNRGGI